MAEPAAGRPAQPGRVKINLPERYSWTDESVWEELERYLFQGFLTATTYVAGKSFVFKTLNYNELRNIEFMRPVRGSPQEARDAYRNALIAHSLFMVDGVNVLYDRPRHIHRLAKTVGKLHSAVREKVVENLSALNERAGRLFPLVEVYVHENRSRFRWMQVRDVPVHSESATGIAGTDGLGMTSSQAMWTAVNRILDRRDDMEREWSNAKFIGSCFAGKGVRAIDERDRARAERERTDLEDRRLEVLHDYLNRTTAGRPKEHVIDLPDGRKAVVVRGTAADGKFRADSAEELRDQLEKSLSGEKDFHDLVIEAKERELMARARAMAEEKHRLYQSAPVRSDAVPVAGGGSMVLGGKEEHDAYVSRMTALREASIVRASREDLADPCQGSDKPGPDGGPTGG